MPETGSSGITPATLLSPEQRSIEMRWNYVQASREDDVWMQYATSITWATGIADIMADFYRYAGIEMIDTGLVFEVPSYS